MNEHKIIINSLELMKEARQYWINIFSNPIEKLSLPTDFGRKIGYKKENISFELTEDLYNKIISITRNENIAIYVMLLSIFEIELYKYSGQKEQSVGTLVYYKSDEQENLNTVLLMKSCLNENDAFKEIVLNLRKIVQDTYGNQFYPLKEILKQIDNDNEIMSLLPVNFIMKNIHNKEHIEYITNSPKNEITFIIEKSEQSILFEVIFNSKLFKIDTIKKFCGRYLNISQQVLNNLHIQLNEIEFVTEDEKHKLLYEFNDTYVEYPKDKTINELFEEQVKKAPDNIAIVFEDKKLTYRELNDKANRLARNLKEKGVKADSIVGIMVERSIEMMVGIIGILKAGGAYLPIDPEYPQDRIEYMIEDSNTKMILTQSHLIEKIKFDIIVVDLQDKELYIGDRNNLEKVNSLSNLAYVIYTSGSTGKPKGVMIEHRNVINFITGVTNRIQINEKESILALATISFDIFFLETLLPMTKGLKVIIANCRLQNDGNRLSKFICENNINIIQATPSTIQLLANSDIGLSSLSKVEKLLVGGEELSQGLFEKLKKLKKIKLYNMYGPTETTVWSSIKELTNSNKVNIGNPISNTSIYILGGDNILQPIGVAGELCISGDGLARGYLNRIDLTEEKFVANPYEQGERMYRTGDLARWLPNGNIEFLGRIDNQVKIRGFRIELGEIENKLLQHEDVKEATVIVTEGKDDDKYICAYIISEKEVSELNLREYLKESLPKYMVPSYFVKLDKMPITSNGKLDRRALSKPNLEDILTNYEAPRNEVEETLVEVWNEILDINKIGINDSFFELGGHSLKAMTLISKIHKETNKEIPLKELFKSPTIKGLSKFIESAEENIYSKIEKIEEKEYYEASSAQKRMYIIQSFDKESIAYNIPQIFEIQGSMDKVKIEDTFKKLVERHETLRTYFGIAEGEIIQKIDSNYEFKLKEIVENKTIEEVENDFIKPFDLGKAPLFRAEIVEIKEKTYLLIDMHHIISDGVSMKILINEFATLHNGGHLETLKLQYKDFAVWQKNLLKSEKMKKQEEYWINMFNDEIPVLNMPIDYERPLLQSFEGDSVSFKVDNNIAHELKELIKKTGITMHMVLLSAFNILLSKYSGQEDIVIGTPIAGRSHEDLQNIIGIFVNTLALRNKPEGNKKYIDFLNEVKENSLEAYENQSYQLETLIEKLDIVRDTSRTPLFDVMFNMVDTVSNIDIKLNDMALIPNHVKNDVAKFDLMLNVIEQNDGIVINIRYCSKLFNKSSIERLGKHYLAILEIITTNNKIKLGEIKLLNDEEKKLLLNEFNDTKVEYSKDKTIQELFESQVEKTPDNIAIIFEDKKLTYRELNEKSNSLARILRTKGVKADSIVGIMVDRSIEMIIGIMGILKAGGAYLPIDQNYPKERIEYMLKDSESKILLSTDNLIDNIEFSGEGIDLVDEGLFKGNSNNLEKINNSSNLAYVIYTSGTTGYPKGVMIEHKSIINTLIHIYKRYPTEDNDVWLFKTKYTFDVSVTEIFGWFVHVGGSLVIMKSNEQMSITSIINLINKYKVTRINFVPAMLNVFNQIRENDLYKVNSLKYLFVAGEELKLNIVSQFYNKFKSIRLENLYGPTEATIYSSMYSVDKDFKNNNIPIGKAISNTKIYICDKEDNLLPIGVAGELCISGDGLARGYLNRIDLTKEKFVANPYEQGERMYRTGDLARWLPDGNIEFLGRIDNQAKIRGFRIELGEIENRLLENEGVKEATVIVIGSEDGDKHICAYIVSEKEVGELNLRDYLKESLPEYMVPSYFVKLEKMPITLNGKLDRRALPKPNLDERLTSYEAPRNELEETLGKIWGEVLGIDKIGINDSFFELGGHSLKAMILISKIHKEINKYIPLKELFRSPTIKEIGKFIENAKENIYFNIEKIDEKKYYEASSSQKRMYIIQGFDKESVAYNMPHIFEIQGSMDKSKLEDTFRKLVSRHESLRTYFETIEDEIVQKIDNNYEFKLKEEISHQPIEEIANDFTKPFDLGSAPLFRIKIVEIEKKRYLLIDMHHIILDGVSISILISEFLVLYNGGELEPLKLQYKDFAAWQNNFLKSEEMKKQEEYWINMFNDEVPILNLPYDYQRPNVQSFEGDSVSFEVDKNLTYELNQLANRNGATIHMIILSAFNILLSKYSGQEDIIVGTPVAGRSHVDLESVVGMFVNVLPLRNKPERSKKYIDFLYEVKESSLKAYDNQSYQIENLVEKLNIKRDLSRNPLFDVMFNTLNMDIEDTELNQLLKPYHGSNKVSKVDLDLTLMEGIETLNLTLTYCNKLFDKNTIGIFIDDFIEIIKTITSDENIMLDNIINNELEDLFELDNNLFLD